MQTQRVSKGVMILASLAQVVSGKFARWTSRADLSKRGSCRDSRRRHVIKSFLGHRQSSYEETDSSICIRARIL